jgi:hypothetical protein
LTDAPTVEPYRQVAGVWNDTPVADRHAPAAPDEMIADLRSNRAASRAGFIFCPVSTVIVLCEQAHEAAQKAELIA